MSIGNKIKLLRKQKNITQSQLAYGSVTRNMISQIENDKASPSLSTLLHFSKILDVPVEYLISQSDDIFPFLKSRSIAKIKNEFKQRHYQGCIAIFEKELDEADDEIALILAHAHIECAKKFLSDGNLITADLYVDKAVNFCSATIYPTHDILAIASLVKAIAENVQSPKLEFDEQSFLKNSNDSISMDLYCYVTEDRSHKFFNEVMAEHLRAKELMRSFHYTDAMAIMSKIEENKSNLRVDATILFNVYCDMEYCCKELRDFEGAYKYSSKRIALLSAFKS